METINFESFGNGDMFGERDESCMLVTIGDKTIAIEATADMASYSEDIDGVIWTHNDPDHVGGLSTYLFRKLWEEQKKTTIVSLASNIVDFWAANIKYMGINRNTNQLIPLSDYAHITSLGYSEKVSIKNVPGLTIETFTRSNFHGPFDTMAFKLLYNNEYILGFSGDTKFDPELIDWLFAGGEHPVIHECGSIDNKGVHTCPDDLAGYVRNKDRLFVNHIPNEEVYSKLQEYGIDSAEILSEYTIGE